MIDVLIGLTIMIIILVVIFVIDRLNDRFDENYDDNFEGICFTKNYLENCDKKYDKINMYINDSVIIGTAIRNIYSFDLEIVVENKFILKVNRYDIVRLWENVRYKDEFNISFVFVDRLILKIVTIDDRYIYQKCGVDINYQIDKIY